MLDVETLRALQDELKRPRLTVEATDEELIRDAVEKGQLLVTSSGEIRAPRADMELSLLRRAIDDDMSPAALGAMLETWYRALDGGWNRDGAIDYAKNRGEEIGLNRFEAAFAAERAGELVERTRAVANGREYVKKTLNSKRGALQREAARREKLTQAQRDAEDAQAALTSAKNANRYLAELKGEG